MSDSDAYEVWANGVPLCASLGLVVTSYDDGQPTPYTNFIDVPGRDGSLDLSDAVVGWPTYKDRTIKVTLALADAADWRGLSSVASALRSMVHGRRVTLAVSWDPAHTYSGRASVSDVTLHDMQEEMELTVVAGPYRDGGLTVMRISAAGGVTLRLPTGDAHVQPTIEVARKTVLCAGSQEWTLQPGSWRLDNLWLGPGMDTVSIDTTPDYSPVTWESMGDATLEGKASMMWSAVASGDAPLQESPTWSAIGDVSLEPIEGERWVDLCYPADASDDTYNAYIAYELLEL